MSAQRNSYQRNPLYVDAEPFRNIVNRWLEVEMADFSTAPNGKLCPSSRLVAIVWPGQAPNDAHRRLYALQHEQTGIHFDTADRIVCKLLGRAELWQSDPALNAIYESVNLISVDIQEPTCAAAAEEIVAMVRALYAENGSKGKTALALGINRRRVELIVSEPVAV